MKYTVEYKNHFADNVNEIEIYARNKIEAYEKAVYETIPEIPYSAWVASVTYKTGTKKRFNTFEGKPY